MMAASSNREIVGANLIARRLGVSTRTVFRWWKDGTLPARKGAGRTSPLRIRPSELHDFMTRRAA